MDIPDATRGRSMSISELPDDKSTVASALPKRRHSSSAASDQNADQLPKRIRRHGPSPRLLPRIASPLPTATSTTLADPDIEIDTTPLPLVTPKLFFDRFAAYSADAFDNESMKALVQHQRAIPTILQDEFKRMTIGIPWLPRQMRRIDVVLSTDLGPKYGDALAYHETITSEGESGALIALLSEPDTDFQNPVVQGRITYLVAHEVFHAISVAEATVGKKPLLHVATDHWRMFVPANETNAYHTYIKSMYQSATLGRSAFLEAYALDVAERCEGDFQGFDNPHFARRDDPTYVAGMKWAATLKAMAKYPDDPFWQVETRPTRAMSDSSGFEEIASVPGASNPLRITDEVRREDETIRAIIERNEESAADGSTLTSPGRTPTDPGSP